MKKHIYVWLVAGTMVAPLTQVVAGTLTVTKQTHSTEGIVGVTAVQTSNSIGYTLAAAYAADDQITFTFNADVIDQTSFPSLITVAAVDSATESESIAGAVLGLLSESGSSVTYRVTSVTQPDDTPGDGGTPYSGRSTVGAVITLGSVMYSISSVSSGDLTMSVASVTSTGSTIDSAASATLATTATQFGSASMSTLFNNVIDVSAARKAFVTETTDTLSWSISNPSTTGWLNLATYNGSNGTVVTLNGESGKLSGLSSSGFTVAGGGTVVYTEASDKVDVSYSGDVTSDTLTFTAPTDTAATVLSVQSFTTTIVNNYTTAGGTVASKAMATALASGQWTLNAAEVVIPYMPYSSNASQIIYVTNKGTQSGDVSVSAYDDSGIAYSLGVVATSTPGKVVKLSNAILTALIAKGFSAGKLTITITVDVPIKDVIVYASYNIGGADRGFINTDQYINY